MPVPRFGLLILRTPASNEAGMPFSVMVMGMVILYAALIIILNLIADMAYAALDPKVRLS